MSESIRQLKDAWLLKRKTSGGFLLSMSEYICVECGLRFFSPFGSKDGLCNLCQNKNKTKGFPYNIKTEYKIIAGIYLSGFEVEVAKHLNDGWKLAGGISYTIDQDGNDMFHQALIRYVEE